MSLFFNKACEESRGAVLPFLPPRKSPSSPRRLPSQVLPQAFRELLNAKDSVNEAYDTSWKKFTELVAT